MARGYEQEWHVSDYPDPMDAFDVTPRGSVTGYCRGDYRITESGVLQYADCRLRADGHIILGDYSLLVLRPAWYLRATGLPEPSYTARNYRPGSTPPVGHDYSPAPQTYILPSNVRRLLAPLEKCGGPALLVAEFVLADIDTRPYDVIYELENKRHDGSFFLKKYLTNVKRLSYKSRVGSDPGQNTGDTMNVTIPNGKELKKALSILRKLKTGTVQIRAYDCFSEDGERVWIDRWNREAVICVKLDGAVAEPGCCGVDLKDLSDAVTNGEITISSTTETVTITGATISKIPNIAYEPAMFGGEPDDVITLTDEDARRIRLSIPFISQDETRIEFTGALIRGGHVVATDGKRLRAAELSCAPKVGVIIPPLVCELVGEGTLSICRDNAVRFESDHIDVIASTIDGQFPDFSKVIPPRPPVTGTLRVSDTLKAVKVLAKGYRAPQALMTAAPGSDSFSVAVRESYTGKGAKKADCTGAIPLARLDGNFSASFNLAYWIDALNGFGGQETVEFGFLDAYSPFVFSKDGVSAAIMPMEWEGA